MLNSQLVQDYLASHPRVVIICVLTIWVALLLRWSKSRPRKASNVHIVGYDKRDSKSVDKARTRFIPDAASMLIEGYRATNGGLYYVPSWGGDRLMIPKDCVEAFKNASDLDVDFSASFREMFEGDYTTIGQRWHLHPRVIKTTLNTQLGDILPSVEQEIREAFSAMPPCEGWTPLSPVELSRSIIARSSNRMLAGKLLSRNEEWIKTSVNFTTDAFAAAQKMKTCHSLIKPIAQYFVPEMRAVRQHIRTARKIIKPILRNRATQLKEYGEMSKPVDLLQMLTDGAEGQDKSLDFLSYTALAVSFAGIHTTSSNPAHLLFDLCARPEYICPLREEVLRVISNKSNFKKSELDSLVKMDSFMKESQRFNPLTFVTFGRKITKDTPLKDSITIPAGTIISVPANAIANDPNLYTRPEEFNGFRFVEGSKSGTPVNFVTTNSSNLNWGYGKHACSGRFFASYEIKIIMAYLLLHYEFKFPDEVTERPKNLNFELQSAPDPNVKVLFRRRKDVA